jgi:xanthine dehydrogenase YagT iron-sulfur-binding subunit
MAEDERTERRPGFSRRDFLRGSAAGALTTGLVGSGIAGEACAAEEAAAAAGVVGPGPVAMRFRINGELHEAELEPRVTLLDALRERFGLTGAKRVCDRGTCGACTVLLDGRTVYACSVLAIEAATWDEPREIRTVEGLGTPESLHPLQAAFVENDAQQCGFCTPGFVVSSAALLDENPHPTPQEAAHGLAGNFCRCGTYAGIQKVMAGGRRG